MTTVEQTSNPWMMLEVLNALYKMYFSQNVESFF